MMTTARFDGADAEWDRLVAGLDGSTFCHLAGWASVMSDVLGHTVTRWVAMDAGGAQVGALPLVHVRSRLFGSYLLSMPFLSYGGPLGPDDAKLALIQSGVDEARRVGADLLELRVRSPLPGELSVSDRKITVLKSLAGSSEELWKDGIRAKLRSQIRRPMKAGMEARFGLDLVEPFYDVFSRTMRDLGTPVLSRAFFRALCEVFPDQAVVGVVELEGEPVAAGFGFHWGDEVEITWAGARREYSREAPNMLLYWSFMEESMRRGATTFNFGRCTPESGTHRFKKQWGAEDHALPWAQWSPTGLVKTPDPNSPKFRLATSVWSRLPVPITNTVGPFLSRSLP